MAKVIEFYVPEEPPKIFEVGSSAAVRKGHRVLLADKEISLAQPVIVWNFSGSTMHSLGSHQARNGRNTT